MLAGLLGSRGHRVAVIERHHEIYPLPRAGRSDGEVLRVMQNLGVMDDIAHELLPVSQYTWFGADGDPIMRLDIPPHPSGWADVLFHQPTLEAALRARVGREPSVDVMLGWMVETVSQTVDEVALTARSDRGETTTIRSRYVVGADGANSVVRQQVGVGQADLGFSEYWLVVDIRPFDMTDFAHLPTASQRCDPLRPMTVVGNGTRHRRWEFMLLPGETPDDFTDPARIRQLLGDVASPDRAELVRHAVYNFRSLIADSLQEGRVFLAGDAAHVMPPFLGEGLCTGIRDANNLAWKLDLVVRDLASPQVLRSYGPERLPFVHRSVHVSVEMGKVSCELDPAAAAGRDAAMRSGEAPPPLPPLPPPMYSPLIATDPDLLAGGLSVQGNFATGDSDACRADDLLGSSFTLIVSSGDPLDQGDPDLLAWFASIDGTVATLDPAVVGHLTDTDGAFTEWLQVHNANGVITRPDQYVFGSISESRPAVALLDQLHIALG